MSMSLKFAMPLLSTLAAMVIIVHSAEEMENYNRHEIRTRALGREFRELDSYEEPWRTLDAVPVSQQTTPLEAWNDSAEDPPRRRRIGRKRKRRPQYIAEDDPIPPERNHYREEQPKSYPEYDENKETTEGVRRRRLPVDWSDEADEHRRQRGLRRRPKHSNIPEPDEYNEEKIVEKKHARKPEVVSAEDQFFQNTFSDTRSGDHFTEPKIKIHEEHEENDQNANIRPLLEDDIVENTTKETSYTQNGKLEDTSLTELSSEIYSPMLRPRMAYRLKDLEQYTTKYKNDLEEAQSNPTRPITLKDILKRSKGKSLSEILQQRNLTLSDLLQGKINALSLLKSGKSPNSSDSKNEEHEYVPQSYKSDVQEKYINEEIIEPPATEIVSQPVEMSTNNDVSSTTISIINVTDKITENEELPQVMIVNSTNTLARLPKIYTRRRFPPGIRRKLRMKPSINSISKTELSRELVALAGRKYLQRHHRNLTKMSEWKDIIPKMMNRTVQLQTQPEEIKIDDYSYTEISFTVQDEEDIHTTSPTTTEEDIANDDNLTQTESDVKETTTETYTETDAPEVEDTTAYSTTTTTTARTTTTSTTTTASPRTRATEKPVSLVLNRITNNGTALRWQAFNNRMKKKRMRQKALVETQKDNTEIFELDNLNPASEFVAKTQAPVAPVTPADKFSEEFIPSELLNGQESGRKTKLSTLSFRSSTSKYLPPASTTEKTAKFEIEEILKDTRTSSTLSKILIERNMTLSELFDHRERGSSHVHLADIFHNASKEPSAPEPFLSKSSIEPISKETYPLRAILEANQHDPNVRATTNEPGSIQTRYLNIPLAMDFRNNVNENAENMGIMALFNNFTKIDNVIDEEKSVKTDSDGSVYTSAVVVTDVNDTNRLGRDFKFVDETARWGDLLNILKNTFENETSPNYVSKDLSAGSEVFRKPSVGDVDGDGLIILEDFQHLNEKISSMLNETLNANTLEQNEGTSVLGILHKPHNTAKSATVAIASIVGLAMVLFLLTYALFKWNQQRMILNKKNNFSDEQIPTPVFEKRKISRFSTSSRSISPMLSCNIYTMDTLESSTGKESPEYMWDNLRKPFQ